MKYKWLVAMFLCVGCAKVTACGFIQHVPTEHVSAEHITKWKGDPYNGPIEVTFFQEEQMIRAVIETNALLLVPLTENQLEDYIGLFTNPEAVQKYKDGQPWQADQVKSAVKRWVGRWEKEQDPFSAFAIFLKKKDNAFIGHIVLGHAGVYGHAELAFLLKPEYRIIELATEAVSAILHGYVPELIKNEYLVNLHSRTVEASPLWCVHATGRFDDTFSGQAMIRSGMEIAEDDIYWDAQRFHYLIRADKILQMNEGAHAGGCTCGHEDTDG